MVVQYTDTLTNMDSDFNISMPRGCRATVQSNAVSYERLIMGARKETDVQLTICETKLVRL